MAAGVLVAAALAGLGAGGSTFPAGAAEATTTTQEPSLLPVGGPLLVIEVKGRIDRVVADFIVESLQRGAQQRAHAVILQVNSPGDLLSDSELDALVASIRRSPVPVLTWVGHIGAKAHGGAARLVSAADYAGVATRTTVGRLPRCPSCEPDDPAVTADALDPEQAVAAGLADVIAPNLGEFVVRVDGIEVGGQELSTARVVETEDGPRLEAAVNVSFSKLDLVARVLHAIASPSVAYLLLAVGLLLVLFEFFSVGVGIAGATGALSLALSAYGLDALGARPLALGLLALGIFGFGVDVQSGAPRAWTVIGGVAFTVGSLLLFPAGLAVPWLTLAAVLGGVALFILRAMPAVTRARFSTATVDRSVLTGEAGRLVGPEVVELDRGGSWRARSADEADPGVVGGRVVVVAADGPVLVIAPGPAADPG